MTHTYEFAFYIAVFNIVPYPGCALVVQKTKRKINRLHERYLRVTYNDRQSTVCLYSPAKPADLATEMYKVSKDLSPPLMRDIFKLSISKLII